MKNLLILIKSIDYASKAHKDSNHLYDKLPYSVHLAMVANTAFKFRDLLPEKDQLEVQAACWTHDTIEDCRQTYNDVLSATSKMVADITYALTNEKGKTRKERANSKYYQGIRMTEYAVFVKLCDRIANVEYSKEKASPMFEKYKAEYYEFERELYNAKYQKMWKYLKKLFNI